MKLESKIGITLSTLMSKAQNVKKLKKASDSISEVIKEWTNIICSRAEFYNNRTERWKMSEKGKEYLKISKNLEESINNIQSAVDYLELVIKYNT